MREGLRKKLEGKGHICWFCERDRRFLGGCGIYENAIQLDAAGLPNAHVQTAKQQGKLIILDCDYFNFRSKPPPDEVVARMGTAPTAFDRKP